MPNLKRLTFLAVLFLVILRMAIGWQMFYEGLWKYEREGTWQEWTSAGYLKNAQGPLRNQFRQLVDDPDDLDWLDYEKVDTRWTEWQTKFADYYDLTDAQKSQLDRIVNGSKEVAGRVRFRVRPKRKLIGGSLERNKVIFWRKKTDKGGRDYWFLVVDGKQHLTPRERGNLINAARKEERKHSRFWKRNPLN